MNLSSLNQTASPQISLEECKNALANNPKATNLVINQNAPEGESRIVSPKFYDHFISAFPKGLMGREKTSDENISEKSRQITKAVFEMLENKYGAEIAHASFSSAPHRIAIAHPLSSKDLSQAISTAEALHDENQRGNFPSNPQIEELKEQAEVATTRAAEIMKATEKKNALLDEKSKTPPVIYKGQVGASALKLVSLENSQRAAHKEAIDIKDRLAMAYQAASKSEHLSGDDFPSENMPLLSRNRKNYGSNSL